jgi:hypothetical protein
MQIELRSASLRMTALFGGLQYSWLDHGSVLAAAGQTEAT